jgi:endoglucanase
MGLATTAGLYRDLTGRHTFDAFAERQVGAAFGANPWGVSFVVGAGTTFPRCMQHQVANLTGSLDGAPPLVLGAAVNGSNDRSQFEDSSSTPDGARACPPGGGDAFARFTGANGARFQDNVGAWMSVEPAIDFTAGVPLALAALIDSEEESPR